MSEQSPVPGELLNCPFCGEAAKRRDTCKRDGDRDIVICCSKCEAQTAPRYWNTEAKELWNTRATPQQDGWRDIESAPKDGTGFIGRKGYFVFWTAWDDDPGYSGWFTQNQFYENSSCVKREFDSGKWEPTHWVPYKLPLPPTQKGPKS